MQNVLLKCESKCLPCQLEAYQIDMVFKTHRGNRKKLRKLQCHFGMDMGLSGVSPMVYFLHRLDLQGKIDLLRLVNGNMTTCQKRRSVRMFAFLTAFCISLRLLHNKLGCI